MTGDPLDHITEWAEYLNSDAECAMEQEGVLCGWRDQDSQNAPYVLALVEVTRAARDLRESLRIETYHGVKYKILCPRCGGLGEVGPENHDDPKAWPCGECEGLGVRPAVLAAIRSTDAALARLDGDPE